MARIKFGPLVSDARGAIAGTIVSRNGSGPYLKSNAMPVNARTGKTLAQRTIFGAIATCWRQLTPIEMNAWDVEATTTPFTNSLGETFFLSGFGLFMKYNMVLVGLGIGSIVSQPGSQPSWPTVIGGTTSFAIIGEESEGWLAMTVNATPMTDPLTDFTLEVFVTPYISVGVNRPKQSLYRRVGYYTTWGVEAIFEDSFMSAVGVWIEGNWMFVDVYIIHEPSGWRTHFYRTTITDLTPPP